MAVGFKRGSPSWWEERLVEARRANRRARSPARRAATARDVQSAERGLERAAERKAAQEAARQEREEIRRRLPRGEYALRAPRIQISENPILYEPGDISVMLSETDLRLTRRLAEQGESEPSIDALAEAIVSKWWRSETGREDATLTEWQAIETPAPPYLIV